MVPRLVVAGNDDGEFHRVPVLSATLARSISSSTARRSPLGPRRCQTTCVYGSALGERVERVAEAVVAVARMQVGEIHEIGARGAQLRGQPRGIRRGARGARRGAGRAAPRTPARTTARAPPRVWSRGCARGRRRPRAARARWRRLLVPRARDRTRRCRPCARRRPLPRGCARARRCRRAPPARTTRAAAARPTARAPRRTPGVRAA